MTTSGYLVGFAPHVYRHVPERLHPLVHELAQPQSTKDAAAKAFYSVDYVHASAMREIKDCLHLYDAGWNWRVALVRLYYGIDRCWCQV